MSVENVQYYCGRMYRSAVLIYGSVYHKFQIIHKNRISCEDAAKSARGAGDMTLFKDMRFRVAAWADLASIAKRFMRYMTVPATDNGGILVYGQQIIEGIGIGDQTVDLENYSNEVFSLLSFTETPPPEVAALEDEYEPEDPLKGLTWQEQHEALYNSLLMDVYRLIGASVWADQYVTRSDLPANFDEALDLLETNVIMAKDYLRQGRGCMLTEHLRVIELKTGERVEGKRKVEERLKFLRMDENQLQCQGGLYAINYDKLPAEWQAKVELSLE